MRPEHVVRKYNQQQRYTQKLKMKNSKEEESEDSKSSSLNAIANKKSFHSSPKTFPTPSHTPSAINQVIQNKYHSGQNHHHYPNPLPSGQTPDYHDILNQLNVYGGPSTDIDPLPGATPPMLATKSNTRIINVPDNDTKRATKQNTTVIDFYETEDKENCPPQEVTNKEIAELDAMLQSIHEDSNTNWMSLFNDSVRKDENSPNSKTPVDQNPITLLKNRQSIHLRILQINCQWQICLVLRTCQLSHKVKTFIMNWTMYWEVRHLNKVVVTHHRNMQVEQIQQHC